MNIETKYNIGDLLTRKYDRQQHAFVAFEVMFIETNSCSAGTQNFYQCRAIIADKKYRGFKQDGEFDWEVRHTVNPSPNGNEWGKFREDELIPATQEQIDIIKGVETKQ